MTNLLDFKNYLVFDCIHTTPRVNTLDSALDEFNINNDTELCKHCFYGFNESRKIPILDNINIPNSKNKTIRKNSPKKNKKRNKTSKQ